MKKHLVFGNYLLLERVNVGGMAEVFIAKSFGVEGFEKLVAIKKILPTMAEDEEFITMFIDEARISVQLSHANVVHIHELGKHEGSYFIAMEYVSGRDLRAVAERQRKHKELMPAAQSVYIASKMCEGLDYAHRKKDARGQDLNIIHRDVSPQNILLSFDGEVKLIDFGIAKAANRSQKTQAGILKGKFGYMSPEQVMGKPIDRRSDVFAVGVILYEMLTGERLFVAESDFSTLEKVRNAEVPPARDFNPNLPAGLEKVLAKALARDPDERYQWCSDLQEDLMRFLISGEGIYGGKMLGAFMKRAFADELRREAERMERFAAAERPAGLLPAPSEAPAARVSPPRPKLQPSVPTQSTDSTPHRAELPKAAPRDATAKTSFDDAEPESPTQFDDGAGGGDGPSEKTQIVDHGEALRKIQAYEARLQAQKAGPSTAPSGDGGLVFDEDEATQPPLPPAGSPKVVIGQGALSGETVVALASSDAPDEAAEPAQQTRMIPAPADEDDTAGGRGRARRRLDARHGDDPEDRTPMPDDAPADDEALRDEGYDPDAAYADDDEHGEYADGRRDDGAEEGDERTASERRDRRRAVGPAPAGRPLGARVKGSVAAANAWLQALEPKQRLMVLGGGGAALLLLLVAIVAGLSSGAGRVLAVAVIPADTAQIEINGHPVENNSQTVVEPGDYEIVATAPGHIGQKRRVHVSADLDPELVQIALEPEPPTAPQRPAAAAGVNDADRPPVAEAARVDPPAGPAAAAVQQPAASAEAPPPAIAAEPASFTATFTTAQVGVEVLVEGRSAGKTPKAQLGELEIGRTYRFEARRSGFKTFVGEFRSEGERRVTVPFELEKEPVAPAAAVARAPAPRPAVTRSAAKGKLACSSRPVGAQIWINGKNTGRSTPLAISNALPLPVGKHKLVFKMNGKASAPVEIEIKENEVTKYVGDLE